MKDTIKDLLNLKTSVLKAEEEIDTLSFRELNSNNTHLFFNVFFVHLVSTLLAIVSLFTTSYTEETNLIIFLFLIFLNFSNVYVNIKIKDKTKADFSPLVFVLIIVLSISILVISFSFLFSFLILESNALLVYLVITSIVLFALLSAESFYLYSQFKKISTIDKNIATLFNQKIDELSELRKQVKNKQDKIMDNKDSLLNLYDAIDSDTLKENDLIHLNDLLEKIIETNKMRNLRKEEEERKKFIYKKEIEKYLEIEIKEKNVIVND